MATPAQKVAISNQSKVYDVIGDDEKITINEIVDRINDGKKRGDLEYLSERTVRRAVQALVKNGHLKEFGRENNAILYGKLSASFGSGTAQVINFNGDLKTVEEFLRLVANPDSTPLQKGRFQVLNQEATHAIRQRLAWVVMTAGIPGMNDGLKQVQKEFYNFIRELEFTLGILTNFVDGPIWYPHYRDKVAIEIRELQKNNPELFQLAMDYSKGKNDR